MVRVAELSETTNYIQELKEVSSARSYSELYEWAVLTSRIVGGSPEESVCRLVASYALRYNITRQQVVEEVKKAGSVDCILFS